MREAVIISAVRTAVGRGKADGSLAAVHPVDLSAIVIQEAVKRADVDPHDIDDVLWGCAMPEGSQGLNIGRLAVLRARLPVQVPAATVNRFCSSGLQSLASAAQSIMSGMADLAVAGGVEMMSQVPMSGWHTRLHPGMTEEMIAMGLTAERVAGRWNVSREDQDAYALESHRKAAAALASGRFVEQTVPVPVQRVTWNGSRKEVQEGQFLVDELVRTDTSLERLGKLKPAFREGGSVTAGNSSPYSDGAAALVAASGASSEAMKRSRGAVPRMLMTPDAECYRVNTVSTYNVIEAALRLGIRKIVIASSETTYGVCFTQGEVLPRYLPVDEEHPTVPHDSYAMSKVVNEVTARIFQARSGADIYALRINNVIEPHEYARDFPKYHADPALRRRNIFAYIDARDLGQMVDRCLKTDGLGYQVFNVSNDNHSVGLTTSEIAARYYAGVPMKRQMGEHETFYANAKAKRLLGYAPRHDWVGGAG